ncbi:MAG: hypothetical protein Q4C11_05060, partial [Clostridium sp.]|nr:hypothetical protein [Clostridium sp.]
FNSFGNTPLNTQSTSEIKHFDTPFGLCQYLILDESLASNLYFEIHLSSLTFLGVTKASSLFLKI